MPVNSFYIEKSTCSQCGICEAVCPALVIEKLDDGSIDFNSNNLDLCLGCGQCMAVCKTKSVFAKGMNYADDFFEITRADDFLSLLESRRSVRQFKHKPLCQEDLNKIINAISNVPHGDAHHNVEITILNSREKIMEGIPLMSEFFDKLGKWLHNPFMRRIIKKRKGEATLNTLKNHLLPRIEKGVYQNFSDDYDGITRGAYTLMIFHAPYDSEEHVEDAFIMVSYASIAAHALGIGATIVGLVPAALNKSPELRKIYEIPDKHNSVISLILGYPKYKYHRGIKRELKSVKIIS
ncbi:MAG: hypothetical protein C0596_01265 [Marinilabiliales bacterium]|nr:MAG: hypothetical protein C0596_01265 [Marinilabiliales bacterium]